MANADLTPARLREFLSYNPDTGVFTRIKGTRGHAAGDAVGNLNSRGYIRIIIDRIEYQAHRLAWLYAYGEWPANEIDHINGIRTDNRLCNLRDVPKTHNQQNRHGAYRNNQSGFLGVHWSKHAKRWTSHIRINGKATGLGYFDTPEDAHAAYLQAKREHHPGNTI